MVYYIETLQDVGNPIQATKSYYALLIFNE